MKYSKKYQRKIKKRILGSISSIAICLMLIAGSNLAGLSTPMNNLKNFLPAKSNADETTVEEVVTSTRRHKQIAKHRYNNIHL